MGKRRQRGRIHLHGIHAVARGQLLVDGPAGAGGLGLGGGGGLVPQESGDPHFESGRENGDERRWVRRKPKGRSKTTSHFNLRSAMRCCWGSGMTADACNGC